MNHVYPFYHTAKVVRHQPLTFTCLCVLTKPHICPLVSDKGTICPMTHISEESVLKETQQG